MGLDAMIETEEAGNHELSTVADGADGRVLDDNALIGAEESLERLDDATESHVAATIVILPLSVHHVMERDQVPVSLGHDTGANPPKLLHVGSDTQHQTQVNAKGTNISTGLARDPEHTEVAIIVELNKLALVDRTNTQLALDGRDQGRALEKSTGEGLEGLRKSSLATRDRVMESDDADVLLTGTLLGLDESGRAINANNCFHRSR